MRFLNGFILIGLMLLLISIGGVASGNRLLTEPGQPPNPYAWLEYLGAAVLMLINGAISISLAAKNRPTESKETSKEKSKEEPEGTPEKSAQ